jgi:non-haem Fe2+, alpha-ketoglutarate-dependent halogenase
MSDNKITVERSLAEPGMGKIFSREQIEGYQENGFAFPAPVLSAAEAAGFLAQFEDQEERQWQRRGRAYDDPEGREWLRKPHKSAQWAFSLATHPRIVDAIEDILGPDILLWDTKLFPKPPRSSSFVSWHQDGTYLGIEPLTDVVTAWVALSESLVENGCMRVLPGTHKSGQRPHTKTFAEGNLLLNGQVIEGVAAEDAVDVPLHAGEMSVHHMMLVHGSLPNTSDKKRIGISINYVTPRARETMMTRQVVLVRGEDRFNHFEKMQIPFAAL